MFFMSLWKTQRLPAMFFFFVSIVIYKEFIEIFVFVAEHIVCAEVKGLIKHTNLSRYELNDSWSGFQDWKTHFQESCFTYKF